MVPGQNRPKNCKIVSVYSVCTVCVQCVYSVCTVCVHCVQLSLIGIARSPEPGARSGGHPSSTKFSTCILNLIYYETAHAT
jgi:hypothetical protein